jgi:hypothetical protein
MFMGCDDDLAADAAERITRTAQSCLQLNPTFLGTRKQMQPVRKRSAGTFIDLPAREGQPPKEPAWATLLSFLHQRFLAGTNVATGTQSAVPEAINESPKVQAPVEQPADQPAEQSAEQPTEAPKPRLSIDHATAQPIHLADYLDEARSLAARCPMHPQVQLAVGGDGRLHVMIDGRNLSAETAVAHLLLAAAWAKQHAELIALTCPDQPVCQSAEPQAHLFTDQPKAYAQLLSTMIDSPIKLHLLLTMTIAGDSHLHHIPLN